MSANPQELITTETETDPERLAALARLADYRLAIDGLLEGVVVTAVQWADNGVGAYEEKRELGQHINEYSREGEMNRNAYAFCESLGVTDPEEQRSILRIIDSFRDYSKLKQSKRQTELDEAARAQR